jgi:hypothetical protein
MKVAALYVDPNGVYANLPDVDLWDEARDARLYDGPHPVVAHPPCQRWSIMGACRGYRDGLDDGCFEAALSAVRRFGGVLEHPAHTLAWRTFALPYPPITGWSGSLLDDGFSCRVDMSLYGHGARKPTWIYAFGTELPELRWGKGFGPSCEKMAGAGGGRSHVRSTTPAAFRDVLLEMARSAQQVPA